MHKHHIVPKYMGGSDEPENIIELTVEKHAEAHRILYEKHGRRQDYLAWKGLTGEIGKEDIIRELRSMGSKAFARSDRNHFKDQRWQKANNPFYNSEFQREISKIYAWSEKATRKREKTFNKIKHQQGENNSQYGKRWIHSIELKKSKRIQKTDPLPENWLEGRKMKF